VALSVLSVVCFFLTARALYAAVQSLEAAPTVTRRLPAA
jgi:hypothetical protein